jgi:hypothetical protein
MPLKVLSAGGGSRLPPQSHSPGRGGGGRRPPQSPSRDINVRYQQDDGAGYY